MQTYDEIKDYVLRYAWTEQQWADYEDYRIEQEHEIMEEENRAMAPDWSDLSYED